MSVTTKAVRLPQVQLGDKKPASSTTICSRFFSLFGFGHYEAKDNITSTSESSDSHTDVHVQKSGKSIKDNLTKANKISFMTNYTLIEGLRTVHVKGSWESKVGVLVGF